MWGTFLSEPLDIVGLVGRYPANYLMSRVPVPYHRGFKLPPHAGERSYGVLVHVSAGYLPVRGWLHTCYSPVRRSPPGYCYPVLPLDLHVLSLSLAFILSQDQTLHTKIILQKFSLAGSCVPRISTNVDSDSRSLRFVHLNILKNSCFLVFASLILGAKADAKIKPFFVSLQIFFKVFSNFFL